MIMKSTESMSIPYTLIANKYVLYILRSDVGTLMFILIDRFYLIVYFHFIRVRLVEIFTVSYSFPVHLLACASRI